MAPNMKPTSIPVIARAIARPALLSLRDKATPAQMMAAGPKRMGRISTATIASPNAVLESALLEWACTPGGCGAYGKGP
jgi:hypothetical protein